MNKKHQPGTDDDEVDVSKRRDEALLRALNTPPVQHKDMKKGTRKKKKRQDDRPTASSEKRD